MRLYECVFIARQDITSTQVEALISGVVELVQKHGGDVKNSEYCGLKNLAYRIKKNRKGHYALLDISCPPQATKELDKALKLNEDVIRHLIVSVEDFGERPSALSQNRYNRPSPASDFDLSSGNPNQEESGELSSENTIKESAPDIEDSAKQETFTH